MSRTGRWRTEGFKHYAIDNGAWTDYRNQRNFAEDDFERLIEQLGSKADWIVLPDIVAGGLRSLELSTRWMNRCLSICSRVLLPVQDGMTESDVGPFVGGSVGLFLGGSTEWKLTTMADWGSFCARREAYFHVGRVNSERRMRLCVAAGADSVDGTGATRYAARGDLRKLDLWSRQPDLLVNLACGRPSQIR